jgi:hypothetical protein
MLLFMSVQLPLDIAAQGRKEMFQGKVAPDAGAAGVAPAVTPGPVPHDRSLWRSVMPRAVPAAIIAAAALGVPFFLLTLAGIVLSPLLLTALLVVATFVPIALVVRRTLPAVIAGHAGFVTTPTAAPAALAAPAAGPASIRGPSPAEGHATPAAAPLFRYLLAEHWAPRLALMTAVNLVLGLMIAQGQAGTMVSAAQAQSDWGITFLILLVFTFSSAADYAAGDVWSGRQPLSKRKGRLGALAILVLLVAIAYAGGFAYQIFLSASGTSTMPPATELLHKMVGVWLGTILGCWIGVSWTLPRASRKVRDRMAYRG